MANDNAVRNQKVFVTLSSVLKLQQQYLNAVAEVNRLKSHPNVTPSITANLASALSRKHHFEQIIELLDLPIESGL